MTWMRPAREKGTTVPGESARPVPQRSRLLDPAEITELQPNRELDALYAKPRSMGFRAGSREEATQWQSQARAELVRTLGFVGDLQGFMAPLSAHREAAPIPGTAAPAAEQPARRADAETIEELQRDGFLQRKVLLNVNESTRMPVYLLVPEQRAATGAAVIAYAGHGYGVKDIVGLWEDGAPRSSPDGYQADFGVALCRRGFVVAAPEIAGFGERQNDYRYLDPRLDQPVPTTCHNAATFAMMMGKSLLGMRVRDGVRLLDYLAALPEVDPGRIGAMGISGGGMLTLFHAAVDVRIRAAVISGYLSSFRDSVLAMNHCTCNFVAGLVEKFEMTDIASLILPRPVLVEAGQRDPIFPVEAVRAAVGTLRRAAMVYGVSPDAAVVLDEFEGRHRISGRRSYDFLLDSLRAAPTAQRSDAR